MDFKDKLNGMQSDYDPQAWNQMEAQLDSNFTNEGGFGIWKFIIPVFFVLASLSIWWYLGQNEAGKISGELGKIIKIESEISIGDVDGIENDAFAKRDILNDEQEGIQSLKLEEVRNTGDSRIIASPISSSDRSVENNFLELEKDLQGEQLVVVNNETVTINTVSRDNISGIGNNTSETKIDGFHSDGNSTELLSSENKTSINDDDQELGDIRNEGLDLLKSKSLVAFTLERLLMGEFPLTYSGFDRELTVNKVNKPSTSIYPYSTYHVGAGINYQSRFYNGYNIELGWNRVFNRFFLLHTELKYSELDDRRLYAIKNQERDHETFGFVIAQLGLVPIQYRGTSLRLFLGGSFSAGVIGRRYDGLLVPVNQIVTNEGATYNYGWEVGASIYQRITSQVHLELHYTYDYYSSYNLRIHKKL